ncbi:MAG: HAMP domain-containing histidine kinase [Saprospiraceae bacterium]|jgi:signal transduction histidine kinase|nr:HAMP domain-containing histidine kinase [Saprospiraceae bacterium]
MNLNFKNRIALLTALAAAATIGLVFVVVYTVVWFTAYDHLDQDILGERKDVLGSLHWGNDSIFIKSMTEWEEKEHQTAEANPTFLQVADRSGNVLFRSANLQKDTLHIDTSLSGDVFLNSRIGVQRIRQGQFPIKNNSGVVIGYLAVGVSREESAVVLLNLRNTLCIAFPALLLILFLATSLAASTGIHPVKKLIRAASVIGENSLGSRLPLPGHRDEIFQLATTINELLQRVENGIQREKQFTADASHELRTPLTAIRGTLEVLLRKQREPAQYEEKIRRVIGEVDRLHGMLEQLLQMARLESSHIPISQTPVDLAALFNACSEEWQPRLQEKGMVLRVQIPPATTVRTDAALLGIVLDNLVGNAIKYSTTGGRIDCAWHSENLSLTVSDNGPGIPEAQLPYLFDRFYRVDNSRNAAVPGSGLGLAIAKKIADMLGIRMTVRSREGEGATFTLQF